MAYYKILEDFVLSGRQMKQGDLVELDSVKAGLKSIQKFIEKAPDVKVKGDGSVFSNMVPGVELTPEQKEKLAKENVAASVEAQNLAADHRARDVAGGREEPPVQTIANAIKSKLEREEFENTPTA
jgi:hypothetical protein